MDVCVSRAHWKRLLSRPTYLMDTKSASKMLIVPRDSSSTSEIVFCRPDNGSSPTSDDGKSLCARLEGAHFVLEHMLCASVMWFYQDVGQ